jgi:ribonuclease G
MGKEFVISANRHETKVAILEDDQLVEIYFQRANEYSLAGSIHKGRVTRVLPGMQSAFVDIGLERDAFLYVSDFFEEHEEYDKITTPAEQRVRKAEASTSGPEQAPKAVFPPRGEIDEEPEAKDRKNRRLKRRRGRARGFPESKYAHEPAARLRSSMETVATGPTQGGGGADEEFIILPGESLAKYQQESRETEPESTSPPDPRDAEKLQLEESLQVSDAPETTAEEEADLEQKGGAAFAQGSSLDETVLPVEINQASEVAAEKFSGEGLAETQCIQPEEAESEGSAAERREEVMEPRQAETSGQDVEDTSGIAEAIPTAELYEEPEEVESHGKAVETAPSLTAEVREAASRLPHRISRRLRKKMRLEQIAETREEQEDTEVGERLGGRDLSPSEKPTPSITDLLREGQEILVQVAKEPLGLKGARITSHIALPGRYVVYMPTVEHLGVSRKITSEEERARLRQILQTHRAGIPGGFIVRTAGCGKPEKEIAADMMYLYNLWLDLRQKAEKKKAPALIHHDLDLVQRLLRDQISEGFKAIWVDNEEVYERVIQFIERMQPGMVGRVKMYTRPTPIFDAFRITEELEKALRPKVWLKSGGYIVVNQTEALVAIDVNTGKFVGKSPRLEDTIVKTNLEAIKEIVRQIRLRDLGGIIVIDFIDMEERKNRQKVMQALEEEMRADRAPYKILQFNDFGLVAITRKRVKQSLERTLCSPCPICEGSGYVKSVQTVIGEILQEAEKLAPVHEGPNVVLRVHPDVAKVLKATDNDYLEELEEIVRKPVLVTGDPQLHPEKFDLA